MYRFQNQFRPPTYFFNTSFILNKYFGSSSNSYSQFLLRILKGYILFFLFNANIITSEHKLPFPVLQRFHNFEVIRSRFWKPNCDKACHSAGFTSLVPSSSPCPSIWLLILYTVSHLPNCFIFYQCFFIQPLLGLQNYFLFCVFDYPHL